ncbi:Response regulator receiver domain-containing protein [Methylophilus rhizosphaerae]|uniref:Response regulator receiver domain-containing protein n=1 Tax=Methylophilus rhizosphaerae TaxID=492660 RepID=A0A1G9BT48_9PROT|nr:response regulator [Methylophilus rhizosphaerae]SDK42622.1 Response regulator receiver domain-containing protein [Methylophilus rhizosphaerae]
MYRLLLVEDSALIRDVIAEMLHDCDQLAIKDIATTSEEAIDCLNSRQYDMVVLDIELAAGTGFDVVRHTQQQGYPFKTPDIIMLTNHGNSYYRNLARTLGVEYFFDKSLQFDECMEVIQQHANTLN